MPGLMPGIYVFAASQEANGRETGVPEEHCSSNGYARP
jgi:hypothetical protein